VSKLIHPNNVLAFFLCLLFVAAPVWGESTAKSDSQSPEESIEGSIESGDTTTAAASESSQDRKQTQGFTKSSEQGIQFKKGSDIGASFVLKIIFSLLFVLIVAYLVILFMKKMNTGWLISKGIQGENIKLIEQKRITPRLSVYVLSVGEEKILMAQCGEHVSFYPEAVTLPQANRQDAADTQQQ
jgi:flagellar biogenesis protein FliO